MHIGLPRAAVVMTGSNRGVKVYTLGRILGCSARRIRIKCRKQEVVCERTEEGQWLVPEELKGDIKIVALTPLDRVFLHYQDKRLRNDTSDYRWSLSRVD